MALCADLGEVRTNIDRLDEQIATLLAERSRYVAEAARFKPTEDAVVVPERVEAVVAHARTVAERQGAEPGLLEAIYRPMVAAFIAFERTEWRRLHAS